MAKLNTVIIFYTVENCTLGKILIAGTKQGICYVKAGNNIKVLKQGLRYKFSSAHLVQANSKLKKWTKALISYLDGTKPWPLVPYDIQATVFQKKVWDTLRKIPSSKTYTYSRVAKAINNPRAVRAVARACAANPALLVIPCHRVVPKSGGVGGFSAGAHIKAKLLNLEMRAK